jgi:hypothetical protein
MTAVLLFLSCVSDEFGSYRDLLSRKLQGVPDVAVNIQEEFQPQGEDTLRLLADYIAPCEAVVHFVGDVTGHAPPEFCVQKLLDHYPDLKTKLPPLGTAIDSGKSVSYTQWEAWLALYLGKAMLIVVPAERLIRGPNYSPTTDSKAAQAEHLVRLKAMGRYPGEPFVNVDNLVAQILTSSVIPAWKKAVSALVAQSRTASNFAGNIQEFLETYLVKEVALVPFGGRDKELDWLGAWLNDENETQRLLLVAPPGRGKSALLVHWTKQLEEAGTTRGPNPKWHLVFVPINIRSDTNLPEVFYQAIAAQLAVILHQELYPAPNDRGAEAYYQGMCRTFLGNAADQNVPILLVIDGIDEAVGSRFATDWFPIRKRSSLRLVVSARLLLGDKDEGGWLQRLRWDADTTTRVLLPLSSAAIESLLSSAGNLSNKRVSRRKLAKLLFDLTKGEPLVLRLLVEDLSRRKSDVDGLTVKDLERIEPGLIGYFKDWMDRQRAAWQAERTDGAEINESELNVHLAVLACAYGPLASNELSEVVRLAYGVEPRLRIADRLYPLRRFIVGESRYDNRRDRGGYILSHSSFSSFLIEEYFRDDQSLIDKAREAFARWGCEMLSQLNNGALQPRKASPYALRHLSQHLKDVSASVSDLGKLVEEGWLRAWEILEGGYSGFSRDVRLTADQIVCRPGWYQKTSLLRCKLVLSSIANQGASLPRGLLVAGFKNNLIALSQIRHWLEYQRSNAERARILAMIAGGAPEAEQAQVVADALDALKSIRDSEHVYDYDEWGNLEDPVVAILKILLPYLTQEQVDEVLDLRARHWSLEHSARALAVTAEKLSNASLIARTGELLDAIEAAGPDGARALASLGPLLGGTELFRALAIADGYTHARTRAWTLTMLISHLPEAERDQRVGRIFAVAKKAKDWSASFLVRLAPFLKGKQLDEAVWLAASIRDEWKRLRALSALLRRLSETAKHNAVTDAISNALSIAASSTNLRVDALQVVAPYLNGTSMAQALSLARSIDDDVVLRVQCLAVLIPCLVEPQVRDEVAGEAFQIAAGIKEKMRLTAAFEALAPILTEERLVRALQLVRAIEDTVSRIRALHALARAMPEAEQENLLKETMKLARSVRTDDERLWALLEVQDLLTERERDDVQGRAIATSIVNANSGGGMWTLWHVVDRLTRPLSQSCSSEALESVLQIKSDYHRSEFLGALLQWFSEDVRAVALREILQTRLRQGSESLVSAASREIAAALPSNESKALFNKVRRVVSKMESANAKAVLLARLIPGLPDAQRPKAVAEALEAALKFDWLAGSLSAVRGIAPYLSTPQRVLVARKGLDAAAKERDATSRNWVLEILVGLVPEDAQSEALDLFIDSADPTSRADILSRMPAFLPVLKRLEGPVGLSQIRRAIEDTARWFP